VMSPTVLSLTNVEISDRTVGVLTIHKLRLFFDDSRHRQAVLRTAQRG
jgi:hypothetical protein